MSSRSRRLVWVLLAVVWMSAPGAARAAEQDAGPGAREAWGAVPVTVTQSGDTWTIAGKKNTVTLSAKDLSMSVKTGATTWAMVASGPKDLRLRSGGMGAPLFDVRLADAGKIEVAPYDAGYKSGVKITLSGFKNTQLQPGMIAPLDLTLYLTAALEGKDEELAFDVAAKEGDTRIDRLDWPTAMDAHDVDYTVLPCVRGVLLPRNWDKWFIPINDQKPDSTLRYEKEQTDPQSNIVEDWSMSWWGFERGKSAMMIIIETPDDAAYHFDHPAGGPTVIGPRWRESLGKLGYVRSGRMCFFDQGNYVDLAKRYRKYAQDSGLWVPLTEKIARKPIVKEMIGIPFGRQGILTNIKEDSLKYKAGDPNMHRVTSFAERADQLRKLKASGIDHFMLVLTSWPKEGYDRQHPDVLPPAPEAGGWEGFKKVADTCKELGYLFTLHDQYRDFYTDAPSFGEEFAVHEEDGADVISRQFPGSRFGQWKNGQVAYMNNWDGGTMSYLNPRFMLGHVKKNYTAMFDHGVHPDGSYQDVFGYVPPDQDFNPEHPTTRTDGRLAREAVMKWCGQNLGIVGTEAGCDFTVPYADYATPPNIEKAIVVPLFNLVYHDAIMSPGGATDVRALMNGCFPSIGGRQENMTGPSPALARMIALHKRVALLEMTKHEFLNDKMTQQRATYSDGTTVTIDTEAKTAEISPELK